MRSQTAACSALTSAHTDITRTRYSRTDALKTVYRPPNEFLRTRLPDNVVKSLGCVWRNSFSALLSQSGRSLLMHDLPLCGMWKGNRCYGNPKPDWNERWGGERVGACQPGETTAHTHTSMQRVIKITKETLCRDLLIRLWRAELEISGAEPR